MTWLDVPGLDVPGLDVPGPDVPGPDVPGAAQYRTVAEAAIVDMLLIHGWRFDVAAGRRAAAEQEARAALAGCVAHGLPHRDDAAGGRMFDPVETWNFLKWAGGHRGDRIWEDRCVSAARHEAWQGHREAGDRDWLLPPAQPPSLDESALRRYTVTIRRRFDLDGRRPGDRVRLRLPLPLEEPGLCDLAVEFLPPADAAVETSVAPGRLDVMLDVPASRQACVGVRASFSARPTIPARTAPLDPAEAELYTRPNEGLIKVSARVHALAADLASDDADMSSVLQRFWTFMLDNLACGSIHYDALDPARPLDWVLEHGWYDCQVGSALLAALCRARGIPARLVTGYTLHVTAPAFHTWMEAWIDGLWMPLDLLCWELSAAGRDAGWRTHYFGRLDSRMVVERPPRLFGGLGAVRLPPAWHMLMAPTERGTSVTFQAVDTGALAYREEIEVACPDIPRTPRSHIHRSGLPIRISP